ncbi:MAG TPA: phosphohydrolase, partial [Trebonia sp.]|nr:phosphohydrolase [Trebonia sp.]
MAGRWYEPRAFPRHTLDSGQWLLIAFAGLLLIWSVAQTGVSGVDGVHAALSFGALIAFGELLRLNLPGDREAAPIATAGAMAYALVLKIGDIPAKPWASQVIAVTAIAMIVGALPHLAVGRPAKLTAMSARLLAVACVAAGFRPLANAGLIGDRWWTQLPIMLGL